jgi:tetratricopeptide (TPR) repeat protein
MYLLASKDFEGALDTFQRALQLTPDDPDLHVMMAYYLIFTGQGERALESFAKALRLSPLFLPPSQREVVGMAHMVARRYEEAVGSFAAVGTPDYHVHVWAAGCLAKLGRLSEARAQSQLASELKPDWPGDNWGFEFKNEEDRAHIGELARLAINPISDGQ